MEKSHHFNDFPSDVQEKISDFSATRDHTGFKLIMDDDYYTHGVPNDNLKAAVYDMVNKDVILKEFCPEYYIKSNHQDAAILQLLDGIAYFPNYMHMEKIKSTNMLLWKKHQECPLTKFVESDNFKQDYASLKKEIIKVCKKVAEMEYYNYDLKPEHFLWNHTNGKLMWIDVADFQKNSHSSYKEMADKTLKFLE